MTALKNENIITRIYLINCLTNRGRLCTITKNKQLLGNFLKNTTIHNTINRKGYVKLKEKKYTEAIFYLNKNLELFEDEETLDRLFECYCILGQMDNASRVMAHITAAISSHKIAEG
jgi:hypothetical protein